MSAPWRDRATWRVARRESLKLSREVIAARLGVSLKRMSFLETGLNKPSEEFARAWDDALYREAV